MKNFDVLKSKEELIYDLIFTEKVDFNINISDYVDDIYNYEDCVSEIKKILKKSKVKIISSVVKLDSKTATWELKVKK